MDLHATKQNIAQWVEQIHPTERCAYLTEIKKYVDDLLEDVAHSNSDVMMHAIQDDLRKILPIEAVLPSEQIVVPSSGQNTDCRKEISAHVDSFLYDEEAVDSLCDEGKMSRHYCSQCGSRCVKLLNFISHSSSLNQLKYIFEYLLPDLTGKIVLDVGSRTGAVLYTAYHYSNAANIIGVELNEDFCKVQHNIIDKYALHDRCKVIHSDICNQTEIIQSADVIIMNNVFEFFASADIQQRIWQFLNSVIRKPETFIVTSPSIEEAIQCLQTGIALETWIEKIDTSVAMEKANLIYWGDRKSEDSDLEDIHLYKVHCQMVS